MAPRCESSVGSCLPGTSEPLVSLLVRKVQRVTGERIKEDTSATWIVLSDKRVETSDRQHQSVRGS